jgi:phosphoenolpyruvate synthase/pyruvate phosphate dikinase
MGEIKKTKQPLAKKEEMRIDANLRTDRRVLIGEPLVIANKFASGKVIKNLKVEHPEPPFIIVLENGSVTEADSLLFKASGIITRTGNRLSHLAVVARELDIPYVNKIDINMIKENCKAIILITEEDAKVILED